MTAKVEEIGAKIRLLVLDVDGVLTDGGLYYDHEGRVMKRFNVQDGLGIKMAQSCGLEVAVITGLNHGAVEARVRELGIERYYAGNPKKIPHLEDLREKTGIQYSEMAYLGDDWVDVAVMRMIGLPMAVQNARPEVKKLARWTSPNAGGNGAVRDAIQFLLQCRGQIDQLWNEWGG